MITRSKEVSIYKWNYFSFWQHVILTLCSDYFQLSVVWDTAVNSLCQAHSVEIRCCDCCVPSEGICLCFIPSQDSRRERSNNFQAFVKMALETLLGSCRRKHGGPRGRQGWVRFSPPLSALSLPWACKLGQLCGSPNTASAHLSTQRVNPISIHRHLLFNLCSSPASPTHTVLSGLLDAQKQTPG